MMEPIVTAVCAIVCMLAGYAAGWRDRGRHEEDIGSAKLRALTRVVIKREKRNNEH